MFFEDTDQIAHLLTLSVSHGNDQRGDRPVALLESRGTKGCVRVNGKTIKKNTTYDLKSGDEVAFGFHGTHAYVSLSVSYCYNFMSQ